MLPMQTWSLQAAPGLMPWEGLGCQAPCRAEPGFAWRLAVAFAEASGSPGMAAARLGGYPQAAALTLAFPDRKASGPKW